MTDVAVVVYLIQGTTREDTVTGEHISVQMQQHATVVRVTTPRYARRGQVERFYRHAEYVEVTRGA